MNTHLLSTVLNSKRDLLVARQRARQLAGLLGFAFVEQMELSAAVFEIAWNSVRRRGRTALNFVRVGNTLQVFTDDRTTVLERSIPDNAEALSPEDVAWTIQQLAQCTPMNLIEEIHQQNQELLRVLQTQRVAAQPETSEKRQMRRSA